MRILVGRRGLIGRIFSAAPLAALAAGTREAAAAPGPAPMAAAPSILEFGAVADDRSDNAAAIQRAVDTLAAAGGGCLTVPPGRFRIDRAVRLRSGIRLQGVGPASVLHLVNAERGDALRGEGTATARLARVTVRDLTVAGDARYAGGRPSVANGGGLTFIHADDCEIGGVCVIGFSDGGIAFLNGNRNCVTNCLVEQTAQGIAFNASDMTVTGNVAVGNRIRDTGAYNGLHLEGGFGGKTRGEVRHSTLCGNTVSGSWEAGINIELAPYTSCVGNTVYRSGQGGTSVVMGVKVFGGYRSALCGNTVADSSGVGILIGANSGECAIEGNVTAGNQGGSLLLTDSGGVQISHDVAIGSNSFTEGDPRTSGNVRIRNRTTGLRFANRADPDSTTLDWYQEGRFTPIIEGAGPAPTGGEGRFTRVGNLVYLALRLHWPARTPAGRIAIDGLPYPAAIDTSLAATWRRGGAESTAAANAGGRRVMALLPPQRSENPDEPLTLLISGAYLAVD